jgi:hypothetical protein
MTAMTVFNLIAAIVVVAGLAVVCRTAYVLADRKPEEPAPVEAAVADELKRAA